ncbi:MAG: cation diffusion facilitator family transporter [Brockia lithotrophica]|nr:cation diffusion facilitator family transporter [Brockia lithotrophica]
MEEDRTRARIEARLGILSAVGNAFLALLKLGLGWAGQSRALFSDGVHNVADLLVGGVGALSARVAEKPPDEDHPYGHGKAEVLVAAGVAAFLSVLALLLVAQGIASFGNPEPPIPSWETLAAALFSLGLKVILYRTTIREAERLSSYALRAVALDHRSDIWGSAAAASGILGSYLACATPYAWFRHADAVGSIVVAVLILHMAYDLLRETGDILMERTLPSETLERYAQVVRSFPEVRHIDRLRARTHGHYILVDLRIAVDEDLTVAQGHELGRAVKEALIAGDPRIREVLVHLNPYPRPTAAGSIPDAGRPATSGLPRTEDERETSGRSP